MKPWTNNKQSSQNYPTRTKRLSPAWISGVKRCFVCGENGRRKTQQKREDVTAAINKLKANHPQDMLSVKDLAVVMYLVMTDEGRWETTEDEEIRRILDYDANYDVAFMAWTDTMNLQMTLSNKTFCHGRTHYGDLTSALLTMSNQLKKHDGPRFKSVTIDMKSTLKSVMIIKQYKAYEREFRRKIKLRPWKKGPRGIWERVPCWEKQRSKSRSGNK